MRFPCWHNWTKWGVMYSVNVYGENREIPYKAIYYQERICNKCGKTEIRKVREMGAN